MTERNIRQQPEQSPQQEPWDIQGMAEALAAETELVNDPYHGQGVLFRIGLSRSKLAAWQQDGYVEAQSEAMHIRMARVERPGLDPDAVVLYSNEPRQVLWINRSGNMTAHAVGLSPAPEHLYPAPDSLAARAHQPPPEQGSPGSSEPASQETSRAAGAAAGELRPEGAEQREQSNRVEIIGRVGWEPKFREFQSGNARLQFSISQAMDDGSTKWHSVKAFKERARKYKDAIHKGDAVHLVGGKATEKYKDKKGQEHEREFIILWGLKPLSDKAGATQ